MDSDINSNSSSDEEDFNEDWIEDINRENEKYNDFFITENESVNIKIYYINRKNELFTKKIFKQNISNGLLKKESLLLNLHIVNGKT